MIHKNIHVELTINHLYVYINKISVLYSKTLKTIKSEIKIQQFKFKILL
jgi:hypothetical protein